MADALALVELDSVARGYRVLDALAKRSPVAVLEANLVEPGHFLILFAGGVAEVEEAMDAARLLAADALRDQVLLPYVHPSLLPGLAGTTVVGTPDCLGVVEGRAVASTLEACDRALKDADVGLCGLRLTPALGGRAFFVVQGLQHDVEAALEAAGGVLDARERRHRLELIPRPHEDLVAHLLRPAPFSLPRSA